VSEREQLQVSSDDLWIYDPEFFFPVRISGRLWGRNGRQLVWQDSNNGSLLCEGTHVWRTEEEARAGGVEAVKAKVALCERRASEYRGWITQYTAWIEDSEREAAQAKGLLAKMGATP